VAAQHGLRELDAVLEARSCLAMVDMSSVSYCLIESIMDLAQYPCTEDIFAMSSAKFSLAVVDLLSNLKVMGAMDWRTHRAISFLVLAISCP
jgi:hypothetical protein